MLDTARAAGIEARIGLRLEGQDYLARLSGGAIAIAAGPAEGADLLLEGAPRAIAAAIYGGQPWAGLEAAGALRITGDRALAGRLPGLFPLPPKAPPPATAD
ncbi:hypothetical protein ACFQU7_18230 [Pseudoroseomonas wenyumeiae]